MCSDFFERSFNNPKFMESQSMSITMKGCTEAAMKAIVDYIYTGDTDLSNYDLATLLRIMNFSQEILIEDDLFNRIEAFLRNFLPGNEAEPVLGVTRVLQLNQTAPSAVASKIL